MKVIPDLVDKIDLRNTDVFCADKGYDPEALREHTKQGVVIVFLENEMLIHEQSYGLELVQGAPLSRECLF